MTDRVVDGHGRVWVTTARGAAELGDDVNEALIRDWARRRRITGQLAGGRRWYRLDQLRAVELATFGRSRPRQTATCLTGDEEDLTMRAVGDVCPQAGNVTFCTSTLTE